MVAVTVSSDSAIVKFCAKHSGAGPELPSGPPLQAAALDFRGGDLFYDGKGINYKVRFVLIIEGVFCFRMRFCFLVAHREFFFFFLVNFLSRIVWFMLPGSNVTYPWYRTLHTVPKYTMICSIKIYLLSCARR